MDTLYWYVGYFVFWTAVLLGATFGLYLLLEGLWARRYEIVHWNYSGLWILGWKLSTLKQKALVEQRSVESGRSADWIYRSYYEIPMLGVCLYWSHQKD